MVGKEIGVMNFGVTQERLTAVMSLEQNQLKAHGSAQSSRGALGFWVGRYAGWGRYVPHGMSCCVKICVFLSICAPHACMHCPCTPPCPKP
jgi:hypothetical protein